VGADRVFPEGGRTSNPISGLKKRTRRPGGLAGEVDRAALWDPSGLSPGLFNTPFPQLRTVESGRGRGRVPPGQGPKGSPNSVLVPEAESAGTICRGFVPLQAPKGPSRVRRPSRADARKVTSRILNSWSCSCSCFSCSCSHRCRAPTRSRGCPSRSSCRPPSGRWRRVRTSGPGSRR